jgi:hypothetical protein
LEDGVMGNLIITSAAVSALLSLVGFGPAYSKHVTETTTYLGNSDNEADEGQGGQGATEETTTGPKGQVINNDNTDCNNCDTTPRDKPGRDR